MVVTEDMVAGMKKGAVIVDIAVDQGGCIETTRETTHAEPVYEVHGVLHYAVGNVPGAVPHTSTYALTNATLHYIVRGGRPGSGRRGRRPTRRCARASTPSAATSPTRRWPTPSAGRRSTRPSA